MFPFFLNWKFKTIVDSYAIERNNTEIPCTRYPVFPMAVFCAAIVQYHSQEIDTDKIRWSYSDFPFPFVFPKFFIYSYSLFAWAWNLLVCNFSMLPPPRS